MNREERNALADELSGARDSYLVVYHDPILAAKAKQHLLQLLWDDKSGIIAALHASAAPEEGGVVGWQARDIKHGGAWTHVPCPRYNPDFEYRPLYAALSGSRRKKAEELPRIIGIIGGSPNDPCQTRVIFAEPPTIEQHIEITKRLSPDSRKAEPVALEMLRALRKRDPAAYNIHDELSAIIAALASATEDGK